MEDLTILLCLKDRKNFTKRWLDWMVEEKCPFNILIADGDKDKSFTKNLLINSKYKDLNISYKEYPEDISLQNFVNKFNDAVSSIRTEYMICADNDDFVLIENLRKAIEFFKKNKQVETLALSHYRFSIESGSQELDSKMYMNGSEIKFQKLQTFDFSNFSKMKTTERLKKTIKDFPSDYFFYAIHKTVNFKKNINVTSSYPIEYMFFWERHLTYSIGILGNINSNSSLEPFVVRQEGTSISASKLIEKERLSRIRFTTSWKEQYPNFVRGLHTIFNQDTKIRFMKFKFFFDVYYSFYIYSRILHGIFGSFLRGNKEIYLILSNIVLKRLNKKRINLGNKELFSSDLSIKKLVNFLQAP